MRRKKFVSLLFLLFIAIVPISILKPDGVVSTNREHSSNLEYSTTILSEKGGNGLSEEAINWIGIDDAIIEHIDYLRYNTNAERIAILDSGLDHGTWDYYKGLFGNYLEIRLFDTDGSELYKNEAKDNHQLHHGSTVFSMLIQMLQSAQLMGGGSGPVAIETGITMFISNELYYEPDPDIMNNHLNYIINWNNQHTIGKYKVIFTTLKDDENNFKNKIDTLVNTQDCIFISSSGNYNGYSQIQDPDEAHDLENLKAYPASDQNVFGAGAIYGKDITGFENVAVNRCSIKDGISSLGGYFGSHYWQSILLKYASVQTTTPGFEVEVVCDMDNNGNISSSDDFRRVTGTSYSAPQLAASAYLASRLKYKLKPWDPLDKQSFMACIQNTCENDPVGRELGASQQKEWEMVAKPIQNNYGTYSFYHSRRVGYGSLDVYDLLMYITTLS